MPILSTGTGSNSLEPGVLFQFTLFEFLNAALAIQHLGDNSSEEEIDLAFTKLTGSGMNGLWTNEIGFLPRLIKYCDALKSAVKEKELVTECKILSGECWVANLKAIDEYDVKQMKRAFLRLKKLLTNLIFRFCKDENVLYFLLRNSKDVNTVFGKNFLPNLILETFPNGFEEAKAFLIERYRKRGFDSHIPEIHTKFEEIPITLHE